VCSYHHLCSLPRRAFDAQVRADALGTLSHARQAPPTAFFGALERKACAVVRDFQIYGFLVEAQADEHLAGMRVLSALLSASCAM